MSMEENFSTVSNRTCLFIPVAKIIVVNELRLLQIQLGENKMFTNLLLMRDYDWER